MIHGTNHHLVAPKWNNVDTASSAFGVTVGTITAIALLVLLPPTMDVGSRFAVSIMLGAFVGVVAAIFAQAVGHKNPKGIKISAMPLYHRPAIWLRRSCGNVFYSRSHHHKVGNPPSPLHPPVPNNHQHGMHQTAPRHANYPVPPPSQNPGRRGMSQTPPRHANHPVSLPTHNPTREGMYQTAPRMDTPYNPPETSFNLRAGMFQTSIRP